MDTMKRTFIIAEGGLEHLGDFRKARELINAAHNAEADAIKFQIFWQIPHLKQYELGRTQWLNLWGHAHDLGIPIFATCFTPQALRFAANILDMRWWKIPSGLATCWPHLLQVMAQTPERVYLSTGMCTEDEILAAATILAQTDLTVMHCTTAYPPPRDEVNLRAIAYMKDRMGFHKVGFSDHTRGWELTIAAVAMGAGIVEKHLTLDGSGPDGHIALEPWRFKNMVGEIRRLEDAMGIGVKGPTKEELESRDDIRKWQGELWETK